MPKITNSETAHKKLVKTIKRSIGFEQQSTTISKMAKWQCMHCKRDNFKTQGGLKQHLRTHSVCSQLQKISAIDVTQNVSKGGLAHPPNAAANRAQMPMDTSEDVVDNFAQLPQKRARLGRQHAVTTKLSGLNPKVARGLANAMQKELMFDAQTAQDSACNYKLNIDEVDNPDGLFLDIDDESVDIEHGAEEDEFHFEVNPVPLQDFKDYVMHARQHFVQLDRYEVAAIKLMDTLRRKKATLDTYDAIMEWHFKQTGVLHEQEKLGDTKDYLSRKVLIPKLAARYHKDPKMLLQIKDMVLPSSRSKVRIVWHDARDCVVSLLTDPRLQDKDYLFFDDDPFAPPPDDLDYIGDVNTGSAYIETYKKLITRPGRQILVPIIMYIDGAVTGQFDKLEIVALQMTLGIFNRSTREKDFAWRKLGYAPNVSKETSRGNKIFRDSGHLAAANLHVSDGEGDDDGVQDAHHAQDYHSIIAQLLASYGQMEKESMLWDLNYRGKLYKDTEFVFFFDFLIVDNAEADKLCGQYCCKTSNVACICRYCVCPTMNSNNQNARYPYKTEAKLKRLVETGNEVALKNMSQQNIKNAFHGLRFGLQNKRGVHGACPAELLHSLLLGIFKRLRDCFFEQIGKTSALGEEINSLSKLYGGFFARQSDRDLPKTNFAKGIHKGKIQAKEMSGVMLVIAAILQSTQGRAMLSRRRANFGEQYLIDDWVLLVETMLEWEQFLTLDRMELKHVKKLERKHKYLMYLIKKVGKRADGMGFNIIKFHAILHMVQDILMFGVCMNYDSGSNESGHKVTKVAAKLTQKNISTFETQTETRLQEFHILDCAIAEINGNPLWEYFDEITPYAGQIEAVDVQEDNIRTGGAIIQITFDEGSQQPGFQFGGTRMLDVDDVEIETDLVKYLHFVQEKIHVHLPQLIVRTEHVRNGQIFRGHPHYRKAQWNDWVIVDWGAQGGQMPAEIWCFVDLRDLKTGVTVRIGDCFVQKGVYAVVESGCYLDEMDEGRQQMYATTSSIFRPFFKEVQMNNDAEMVRRKFYLADVEAFVEPVTVVPDVGCADIIKYFALIPRRDWAGNFTKWLDQPHILDNMDDEE